MRKKDEAALNGLDNIILTLGIKARFGISPKELKDGYAQEEKNFERKRGSEGFKNVVERRKCEKDEIIAPLWKISDEKFWDDSFPDNMPDSPYYVLATSQLGVLGEETNTVFVFVNDKLRIIFISPWKRINNPGEFKKKLNTLIDSVIEKYGSPYVKEEVADNLAWDKKTILKWKDIEGNILELRIYFKKKHPDGFEVTIRSGKLSAQELKHWVGH